MTNSFECVPPAVSSRSATVSPSIETLGTINHSHTQPRIGKGLTSCRTRFAKTRCSSFRIRGTAGPAAMIAVKPQDSAREYASQFGEGFVNTLGRPLIR